MSLSTLCTNTFRKTDAYFSPFGATANGFAVHVIMSMTATTITEVSINFDPILETVRYVLNNYFKSEQYCYLFLSGGVESSRPWDKEWNGGMVVSCEGMS